MRPMLPVPPVVLEGRHVRLEPLSLEHIDALVAAAAGPRGTFAMSRVPHGPDEVHAYVTEAMRAYAEGNALPFATRSLSLGRVVGSTRFGKLEYWTWPAG